MTITLKEWLKEKPFTLTMSSGFFAFYAHLGFLSVLEEENLLPNKITGSSAGALIGGLFATGLTTKEIKDFLFQVKKEDFWDPMGLGGFLKGDKFRKILDLKLKTRNIENTRIKWKLSVFNLVKRKTDILENGDLVNAIYASCAVPFMFQPMLINKNLYADGGVKDRPGIKGVKQGERVFYHHIISNSYWRKKIGNSAQIPKKDNMAVLSIKNLPKVRPNKLETGISAYNMARRETKKALEMPVVFS